MASRIKNLRLTAICQFNLFLKIASGNYLPQTQKRQWKKRSVSAISEKSKLCKLQNKDFLLKTMKQLQKRLEIKFYKELKRDTT